MRFKQIRMLIGSLVELTRPAVGAFHSRVRLHPELSYAYAVQRVLARRQLSHQALPNDELVQANAALVLLRASERFLWDLNKPFVDDRFEVSLHVTSNDLRFLKFLILNVDDTMSHKSHKEPKPHEEVPKKHQNHR